MDEIQKFNNTKYFRLSNSVVDSLKSFHLIYLIHESHNIIPLD